MQQLPEVLIEFGVALGIGLMLGVERERNKGTGPGRAAAGVRTFMLFALAGALADWIGSVGLLVAGAFVCLLVFASYRRSPAEDPGLTTEIAM
ncbi:MAG: MgtC/SapB family protein, partial [Arenimonas sp.]